MPRTATKPKLIFHIGHHKTGSTSIQEAFATGKIQLPGKQILYPTRLNHNYLRPQVDAFARDGKVMPGNAEKPGPARIGQMLQDGAWDYVVISGEEFEGAKPAELQQTIQQFWQPHISDHLVICYVRPHAGRTLSTFAEDIKIGRFADTPEQYHQKMLREGRLLYQRKLTPWTRTFGQNFRVRPMIRDELRNKSAVEDFIAQTFGDDADNIRLLPLTASNESLCIEDLMLLKLVHRQLRDRPQWIRHNIGWEVARLAADEGLTAQRTKPALHKALAQQISRDYRDDARWMDAEFFGGRPVLLRDLESSVDQAIPKAQSYDPKDYFSGQALRAINTMARLTEAMLDNGKSNWGGFLMQRRLNALHEDAKGDGPQPAATKEPADKPQNTVSVQMIDNAVAMRDDDPQRLNNISRRLNNAFLNVKPANVDLTLDQVLDRMDQATPQMRDVLNEFLVQLFFHQHAKILTPRLLRNRTLRDIAKSDPAVGRMVEHLSAEPGIAPHLLTAGEYYLRGQLKPAYTEFDRARQLLLQQGNLRHHNRGLLALRDLDCLARWADEGPDPVLPAMQFTSDKPFDTALPITVIGLDGGYFNRYGRRLIEDLCRAQQSAFPRHQRGRCTADRRPQHPLFDGRCARSHQRLLRDQPIFTPACLAGPLRDAADDLGRRCVFPRQPGICIRRWQRGRYRADGDKGSGQSARLSGGGAVATCHGRRSDCQSQPGRAAISADLWTALCGTDQGSGRAAMVGRSGAALGHSGSGETAQAADQGRI